MAAVGGTPGSSFKQLWYRRCLMTFDAQPGRIGIEVTREMRRRIRLAAALRDQSIRQYVSEALEARRRDDLTDEMSMPTVRAAADPVLAGLWDNPADARYDDL